MVLTKGATSKEEYRGKPTLISFVFTGLTGLEPATSAVTGRCSNRLNYSPLFKPCSIMALKERFVNSFWGDYP